MAQIAKRMGIKGFEFESAAEVFNELCSVSPIYQGLDWDRIDRGEYHWPVPEKGHPGTPILHEDSFKNGRGVFSVVEYRPPAEEVSDDYPVWLTTGRRLQAYHTNTQTGRSQGFDYLLPEEYLEVHRDDLGRYGLTDGGWCTMTSPRGSVRIRCRATRSAQQGTVFCSFAFNDVPVNFLTGSGFDPVTRTPEVKVSVVRLQPAEATPAAGSDGGDGSTGARQRS